MDKSTLLNEIVNHAKFMPMISEVLCDYDTIKDHFYSYDFNKHYIHFDFCENLRADLIKALESNSDSVKSKFLKSFNDASFCTLYEMLASLEGSWSGDFNELIGSDLDDCLIDAFKDLYSKYKSDLISDFKSHLFEFVDCDRDSDGNYLWYFSSNPKQNLAIESVINDHVDNFEFETDIYASVFNCGCVVCGLNVLLSLDENYHEIEGEYLHVFGNMLDRFKHDINDALNACEVD